MPNCCFNVNFFKLGCCVESIGTGVGEMMALIEQSVRFGASRDGISFQEVVTNPRQTLINITGTEWTTVVGPYFYQGGAWWEKYVFFMESFCVSAGRRNNGDTVVAFGLIATVVDSNNDVDEILTKRQRV